jgi:periplasmic divalent cation tolerance protein
VREISQVVITAPDVEWLKDFVRRLLAARLCAGSHIDTIRVMYWWDDTINERDEGRVFLHTRTELVPQIVDLTNQEHPYQVPCVSATPVTTGNPAYLEWIVAETQQ